MITKRSFLIERRSLPPYPKPLDPRAHRAGVEAVRAALFPLATDLRAELAGRSNFPKSLMATQAVGA